MIWFKIILLSFVLAAHAHNPPAILKEVKFEQKIGGQLDSKIKVIDETKTQSSLADHLNSKPKIFVFSYGDCENLCSMVLNGLIQGLNGVKKTAGKDFDVLVLSIDPNETTENLKLRRELVSKRYTRSSGGSGWDFFRSSPKEIEKAAKDLGFHYQYDERSKQFAHASGIVFLTPSGVVSSYLMGIKYLPLLIEKALDSAAQNKPQGLVRDLLLYCFHYEPDKDKYGTLILNSLRAMGLLTMITLLIGLFFLGRKRGKKI